MKKSVLFILSPILLFSCTQSADKNKKPNPVQEIKVQATQVVENKMNNIVFTEPAQTLLISSGKITEITGRKGLKIRVDPSALETENGAPLDKQIELQLKEITNQEELFKNDAPTTSDGRLLVSGGAYHIVMTSGGNNVRIKANRTLAIKIPALSTREMELFYGQRDTIGNLNWTAAGEKMNIVKTTVSVNRAKSAVPVKVVAVDTAKNEIASSNGDLEKLLKYAEKRNGRMSAIEFKDFINNKDTLSFTPKNQELADYSQKVTKVTDTITGDTLFEVKSSAYYPAEIKQLGWINCDRFYNIPNKFLIECEFDTSIHIKTAVLYVVFKSMNAMQKEYVSNTNNTGLLRLNNQYPAGFPVKVIAVTNVNGQFYSYKQDLVLNSKERIKLKFSPVADIETVKQSYRF